ncbi:hypothetical protein [Bradyrhizobium sp. USDA 3364]
MLIAPNTSRDNELSLRMVPAGRPLKQYEVMEPPQGAPPKYRKQPHAKESAVTGIRKNDLTRRATQGHTSNIPKFCKCPSPKAAHLAFAGFCN